MSTELHTRAFNIPPSIGIVVQMASAEAASKQKSQQVSALPATPRKATKRRKPPPETWTGVCIELLYPLGPRSSWVAAMLVVGTADMLFNVTNLVQMSSVDLNYVLVIGPPTRDMWISLCFFTVVGTVLYIPETINTVSAIRRYEFHSALMR